MEIPYFAPDPLPMRPSGHPGHGDYTTCGVNFVCVINGVKKLSRQGGMGRLEAMGRPIQVCVKQFAVSKAHYGFSFKYTEHRRSFVYRTSRSHFLYFSSHRAKRERKECFEFPVCHHLNDLETERLVVSASCVLDGGSRFSKVAKNARNVTRPRCGKHSLSSSRTPIEVQKCLRGLMEAPRSHSFRVNRAMRGRQRRISLPRSEAGNATRKLAAGSYFRARSALGWASFLTIRRTGDL